MPTWASLLQKTKSYQITGIEPNTQYTLSIEHEGDDAIEVWLDENYIGDIVDTLTFEAQVVASELILKSTGDLVVDWVKLEKGNKATDWSPSPEDIDFLNNEISVQVGLKIPSTGEFEPIPMGIFLVDEIDDKDERVFKITCRDRMKLFDEDCTAFLATREYPISLWNLLNQLCDYVGIELENTSIVNGDYLVENSFSAMEIKGQQILSWIGEVAASFVSVNRYGRLVFKAFAPAENDITDRDYINITTAKYTVPQITRLQVAVKEDDLGVIVGTGNITYSIINNPLFYTMSEEQITPAMNNILSRLQSIPTYTPVKLYGKGNPAVETGDIIKVTTVKGQSIDVLVMDRKFVYQKSFRDTYESFGTVGMGEKRIVQSNVVQLKGKINALTRNLDENTLKLVDVEKGYSEISQTVNQNSSIIADVNGKVSAVVQDVDSFKTTIKDTMEDSFTEVNQKYDSLLTTIQVGGGNNLIKNSVGYGQYNFWEISEDADIDVGLSTWILEGTSKHGWIISDAEMYQDLSLMSNTDYTISGRLLKKTEAGTFLIGLYDIETDTSIHEVISKGIEVFDGQFTLQFNTNTIKNLRLKIAVIGVNAAELTDLMLVQGQNYDVWSQASGEIYTLNVKMDGKGIEVYKLDGKGKTVMSPEEFAGYYNNQKVFTLNGDITEVMGLLIKGKGLFMPPAKFVQTNESLDVVWTGVL